jgi:hypothetical protein
LIGYIGSPLRINAFDDAIGNWSASSLGSDWPLYKNAAGTAVPGKIPSALEIFLNTAAFNNEDVFLPAPVNSRPIMDMTTEWTQCVQQDGSDKICPLIRACFINTCVE